MSHTILIEESPFGLRAMSADADGLPQRLQYRLYSDKRAHAGSLYWARAGGRDKRLGLQRFDLGTDGEGMLQIGERQYPEGTLVLVGVRREAIGSKRPLLTDKPSLHLPAATLRPGSDEAKAGPMGQLQPPGTVGLPTEPPKAPGSAAGIPPAVAVLAALAKADTEAVFTSSGELAAALRPFMPDHIVLRTEGGLPQEIRELTDQLLLRTAALEGGGSLVFDETEALTAIDADLGHGGGQSQKGAGDSLRRRVLNELGRQLALRGVGGQVVLDLPRSAVRAPKVLRDGLSAAIKPHGLVSIPAVTKEGLVVLIMGQKTPSLLGLLTENGTEEPIPGRRLRPAAAAWSAYDEAARMLASSRRAPKLRLDRDAAELWNTAGASEQLAARFGNRPDIEVFEQQPRGGRR